MLRRNQPCPCGSGDKYKKCCGNSQIDRLDSASRANQRCISINTPELDSQEVESAQMFYSQGTAFVSEDRLEDAVSCFKKALSLQPAAEVYFNLAVIQERLGALDDAVESCNAALKLQPKLAMVHSKLGKLLSHLGQSKKAIACFRESLAIDHNQAEVCCMLGLMQKELLLLSDASDSFRKALLIKPDYFEAYVELGNVLYEQGQSEEAILCFNKAISIAPDNSQAYFALAFIYEKQGSIANGLLNINAAIKYGHNLSDSCKVKAKLLYMRGDVEQALEQLDLIEIDGCENSGNCIEKYFLLGKYYDRLGRVDDAFKCLEKANAMQAESSEAGEIDESVYLKTIENNKKTFTNDWLARWQPCYAEKDETPVFFAGFPRSGTTLIDQIMDSHPHISVIEEQPLVAGLIEYIELNFGKYPEILSSLTDEQIIQLRTYYKSVAKEFLQEDIYGGVVVDKFPLHIVHLGLIQKVFPGAKVILALRHPLDVCLSNFMQNYMLNDAMKHFLTLEGSANLYAKVMDLWSHYETIFDLDFHVVKYEELVESTECEVRSLLDFLGVEWDDNVLEYFVNARSRKSLKTPSYQDVMQPIYKRSKFRWQNYASHLEPVMPILAPYIAKFGYKLD